MRNEVLQEIYENQIKSFSYNQEKWKSFLKTSSNNYKCNFDEQVLIYSSRPTATAVLEFNSWNKYFARYVKKGSKGIPVFTNDDKVKYYFDIADTGSSLPFAKPVNTWIYEDENEINTINNLEKSYGTLIDNTDIVSSVFSAVQMSIQDLDIDNKFLAINSTAYIVLSRLNKLDENYFSSSSFDISENDILSDIGNIINTTSKEILNSIAEVNNTKKDLLIIQEIESENIDNGENITIQESGRSSSTDTEQRGRFGYRSTRTTTQKIFSGIQTRLSSRTLKRWSTDTILSGRERTSRPDDRNVSNAVSREDEHNSRTQDERPLGVGTSNENGVSNSTRDSEHRSDISADITASSPPLTLSMESISNILLEKIHINKKFDIYEYYNDKSSNTDNAKFLQNTFGIGGHTDYKSSVFYYGKGIELEENNIKANFSWTKVASIISELIEADRFLTENEKDEYSVYIGQQVEHQHISDIAERLFDLRDAVIDFSYNSIENLNQNNYLVLCCIDSFRQLQDKTTSVHSSGDYVIPTLKKYLTDIIDSDIYLSPTANELFEILNTDEIVLSIFDTKYEPIFEYIYGLGDTVYIGADTYEINSIDDTSVLLRNANFPLFTETMELGKFHTRLLENNQNNHLRTIVEKSEDLVDTEKSSQVENPEPKTICETYAEYKAEYTNDIVFYQISEFFEVLGGDAEQVSNLCDIHLTSRLDTTTNEKIKMVGMPKSHINNYTSILGENGYTSVLVLNDNDNTEINIIKPQEKIVSVNETSSDTSIIDLKPAYINYLDTQKDYPDRVILQRNGNFYEAFSTNALIIYNEIYVTIKDDAPTLELKTRNMGLNQDNNVDMVGIPAHLIDIYLDKLRNYGCSLTIIDPLENEISLHHLDYKLITENETTTALDKYFLNVNETDDIIDYVLLSKDIDKYTETAQSAIYNVFTTSTSDKEKLDAVKGYYGNLDTTYITEYGDYMEILKSNSFGLDFIRDEQLFSISYENMVSRISKYISNNIYPHSSIEQNMPYSVEATSDAFDAPFTIINENYNIDDNYVRDEKGDILLFDTFPQALDIADKLNKEYLQNLEATEEQTLNIQDTSKELFVGDIFEYDNKQWKVKENDGFMLTADNTDKDDINSALSWVGSIEQHNYTIIERNNTNISVIKDINEQEIAENTAPEIQFFVDFKDIENDIDYSLYVDGDIIGYNIEGVEYKVGKLGDTVYTTSKACITPYGTVLGSDMSPETYAEYRLWKDNLTPLTIAEEPTKQVEYDVNLDVKNADRLQFKIVNDDLGIGTPTEKITNNINAINTLKKIELEERLATTEEQNILSKYIGWGGLANCFEENHQKYSQIKTLLNQEEYENARASTLTAFYTSPIIIKSIYQAIQNAGFTKGNILEPSCGVGNFVGMLPAELSESKVYGVELDSISGRIAQQLYQKSNIVVDGYENTNLPNNFFDVAIGNVPFGQFKVNDKPYNKHNWLIHDYFFGKTLDKVRTGGIIAFITSKGTLDKTNSNVRKYIAQKADLIGAIRLPNTAFKANAGTEVTSDIIFLQKHDRAVSVVPEWVHLGTDDNGITMNQYFVDNPQMILGEMKEVTGPYGMETACIPLADADLSTLLNNAIQNINYNYNEVDIEEYIDDMDTDTSILATPDVRNFSFTIIDGKIYYRENSLMKLEISNNTATERIKGMIKIRDCVRSLISYQSENFPEHLILNKQTELNELYDTYTKKYGVLSSRGNQMAFSKDDSYSILTSLEHLDEDGNLKDKADIFTKRTIRPFREIESVDTSSEALAISLDTKGKVDLEYMSSLCQKTAEEIELDLKNIIYRNISCPQDFEYISEAHKDLSNYEFVTSDEFLSGNVRHKLRMINALMSSDKNIEYSLSHYKEALEKIQPVDLTAGEIVITLGTPWIPTEYIDDFMREIFLKPSYGEIETSHSNITGEWHIANKNYDNYSVKATKTYGTNRINSYRILELTLNSRDIIVYDYEQVDGKRKAIVNREETEVAQGKQKIIQFEFSNWIYSNPERRQYLTTYYNETFNSNKNREYNGSHLKFSGMNSEVTLYPHQKNAIARTLYGGNTLLAHVVGAGKTFVMVASAMESKRLGLCNKSMFVVPNHLTQQCASEFMELYPTANILVTTKKDFETKNRKKFCARIATGDYDAVIIGHSQFEKISLSIERQSEFLYNERQNIMNGIAELKANSGSPFSIKDAERTILQIDNRLEKLNDQSNKDNVLTFEELGVDKIYVDEAHNFKNLFAFTKMRNVSGIAQTEAQKSSDMFMKCKYLNEITDNKGIVFATGTPVSNTMVELFTMQRYLQPDVLVSKNLSHFDAWASNYGEKVTGQEIKPEGTGMQVKTRFAKFNNVPELMNMFKEVADVQTSDMLNLKTPKVNFHIVSTEASEMQKDMVQDISRRADAIRSGTVDSSEDNMLLITIDGKRLALDQRLINPNLYDFEDSKVNTCVRNLYKIWNDTHENKSTQIVFSDLSTPKFNGEFNVYEDIRNKLVDMGIPKEEIKFIHEANTDTQKAELFKKVRKGDVRILIGSTAKCGAGTNIQDRLIALHDLDVPWRPSDLAQRLGRIERQGNSNEEVEVFRYITKGTFDAYSYQLLENKQKFISQVMTSKTPLRTIEDVDDLAFSFNDIKICATGNPLLQEKMTLESDLTKLKVLKQHHLSEIYSLEDNITQHYPNRIAYLHERLNGLNNDKLLLDNHPLNKETFIGILINGVNYDDKEAGGNALIETCRKIRDNRLVEIGEYRGFKLSVEFDSFNREFVAHLKNSVTHSVSLGNNPLGNFIRIDNELERISSSIESSTNNLENVYKQLEVAEKEVTKPFPFENELVTKVNRLAEVDAKLEHGIEDEVAETETSSVLFYNKNTFFEWYHTDTENHTISKYIIEKERIKNIAISNEDEFFKYTENLSEMYIAEKGTALYDNFTQEIVRGSVMSNGRTAETMNMMKEQSKTLSQNHNSEIDI